MDDPKRIPREILDNAVKAMLVQKNQQQSVEDTTVKMRQGLDDLAAINNSNMSQLEQLLARSEAMLKNRGIDSNKIDYSTASNFDARSELSEEEKADIREYDFGVIDTIDVSGDISWQDYLNCIGSYADEHNIDLSVDPYKALMSPEDYSELAQRVKDDYTQKKSQCDKYDYIIAAASGVTCGLIDAFFVGMPLKSQLGGWTDDMADGLVEKFTGFVFKLDKKDALKEGKKFAKKMPENIGSCIKYLEDRFLINYDARYPKDLGLTKDQLSLNLKDHHLKSLGHAPDFIGLFFSILDQFTSTTTIASEGQFIRIETQNGKFKLLGKNFIAKLFCGFCNWIGHIISDMAGSSTTRKANPNKRGSGVSCPFFEVFQLCDFGKINIGKEQKTIAELSTKIFTEGYDARHGAAMAIPVFLNEIIIRISFALKRKFYHKKEWSESLPFGNQPELRRMLVVGHGCLCLVDGIDAGVRSGGNILAFALRLNFVAWGKFAFAGFKEILIIMRESSLDMETLNKDLDVEWKRLA